LAFAGAGDRDGLVSWGIGVSKHCRPSINGRVAGAPAIAVRVGIIMS
jgi:hypothetical protein